MSYLEDIKIKGGICFNDYISAKYNEINFEYADIEKIEEIGGYDGKQR